MNKLDSILNIVFYLIVLAIVSLWLGILTSRLNHMHQIQRRLQRLAHQEKTQVEARLIAMQTTVDSGDELSERDRRKAQIYLNMARKMLDMGRYHLAQRYLTEIENQLHLLPTEEIEQ